MSTWKWLLDKGVQAGQKLTVDINLHVVSPVARLALAGAAPAAVIALRRGGRLPVIGRLSSRLLLGLLLSIPQTGRPVTNLKGSVCRKEFGLKLHAMQPNASWAQLSPGA